MLLFYQTGEGKVKKL